MAQLKSTNVNGNLSVTGRIFAQEITGPNGVDLFSSLEGVIDLLNSQVSTLYNGNAAIAAAAAEEAAAVQEASVE